MSGFRNTVWPHSRIRRNLLIVVLAVAGLMLGLISMHSPHVSLHADTGDRSIGVSALHHGNATATGTSGFTADGGCLGPCTPDHSMTVMMCLLALLASVLLAAPIRAIRAQQRFRLLAAPVSDFLVTAAFPRAPSLHALSISRT